MTEVKTLCTSCMYRAFLLCIVVVWRLMMILIRKEKQFWLNKMLDILCLINKNNKVITPLHIKSDTYCNRTEASFYSNHFFQGTNIFRKLATVIAGSLLVSFSCYADRPSVKSLLEIRQQNIVVQKWDLSCGAATLATLLNFQHNDPVTEKEVANELMNRSEYIKNPQLVRLRQGFSLLDLKRYVDARKYRGIGLGKLTLSDLEKKAPIIIPVNMFGYNHFVIFRGILGNRVLLADPAWGNRTMLVEQFEKIRIEFPKIGKVGFVISSLDGMVPENRLALDIDEFVMLR